MFPENGFGEDTNNYERREFEMSVSGPVKSGGTAYICRSGGGVDESNLSRRFYFRAQSPHHLQSCRNCRNCFEYYYKLQKSGAFLKFEIYVDTYCLLEI